MKMITGRCFLFSPTFEYLKNGCGFRAFCPKCNKKLQYSHGCNRAGLGYAELAAHEKLVKHLPKCPKVIEVRNGAHLVPF